MFFIKVKLLYANSSGLLQSLLLQVAQEWPGLPRGVKFDPSDSEIMYHLLAKAGLEGLRSHSFINEFIPTVDEDDGICYTHPQNLPGEQNILLLVVGIVLVLDLSLSASHRC